MRENIKNQIRNIYDATKKGLREGYLDEKNACCIVSGYVICLYINSTITKEEKEEIEHQIIAHKFDRY